jgi:hypothetical protein
MAQPKASNKIQAKRVVSDPEPKKSILKTHIDASKKLYVHINDPDDHDSLLSLKKICSNYSGESDIVLVLGAEKKSAIKLPFGVSLSKELISELNNILGNDKVIVK